MCQKIRQPRRNRQLAIELQPTKTESRKIDQLNRLNIRNATDVLKHSLQTKAQDHWLQREILPKYREELIPSLKIFPLLKKIFYEATITFIPKSDQDTTNRKL